MAQPAVHIHTIKRALAANGEMRQAHLATSCSLPVATFLAAIKPGLRSGEVLDRREGRSVFYRLAEGVTVDPAPDADEDGEREPFHAALWTDGDLDLYGVIELEDGGVRITADGVRQLCRLLHGQGPEQ